MSTVSNSALGNDLKLNSSPKHMSHVAIKVSDLDSMSDWYITVFNAEPRLKNKGACFVGFDGEDHRIALLKVPGLSTPERKVTGVEHVTFTFAELGQLLGNYQRLKDKHIEPYWCVNHGMSTSMYYEDPEGNHIELQVDNHESPEALEQWYASGQFPTNGLGTNYDPAVMIEKFCAGVSVDELLQPGSAPGPGCGAPRIG